MDIISWTIEQLLQWYVWLPVVLLLVFLTWRNYKKIDAIKAMDSVLLVLDVPKTNDKKESAAEQLFTGLRGILRDANELRYNGGFQEHVSLELVASKGKVQFYLWTPRSLQGFVEGQLHAQYPSLQIHIASEDYVAHERRFAIAHSTDLVLSDSEYLPIKTYEELDIDPFIGLAGTLAKLDPKGGEEAWLQILVRPVSNDWHSSSKNWIESVKNGGAFSFLGGLNMRWVIDILGAFVRPPKYDATNSRTLSEQQKKRIEAAEKKAKKPGLQTKIRIVYLGSSMAAANLHMQAIVGNFKQYANAPANGFRATNSSFKKEDIAAYKARLFIDRGFILTTEELASIFHLPHAKTESPSVNWANTPTVEPPEKLPIITGDDASDEVISAFGIASVKGIHQQFGLQRYDRSRHVYIIGQTGTGKTGTLELLALSDIFHGHGYAIIDPHGDLAVNNLRFIPGSRLEDVVYFNPADMSYPLGFNPLELSDPSQKTIVSSEVIGVFKRMFSDSWGPRLEYILRYTILALLDRPETTLLDITRMLTDKTFRQETLSYCQDTVVLQFWNVEFEGWNDRFQSEAVAPVLNKVGAFTANPVIRNIVGQPKSTFNIRQIMDEGKILIVNLSKGLVGEDNASILGALIVTKIQLAAMSRSDIPDINDRRPFYLYVDEFQNFATDSFAGILSEARKYGLHLTVANQYIAQMSETVRNAVFGNVGTLISFRVSADDAAVLARQFQPQFTTEDLLKMNNRTFITSMIIGGEKMPPFMAKTLTLPAPQTDNAGRIIEYTRTHYAQDKAAAENAIMRSLYGLEPTVPPYPQRPAAQVPVTPTQHQAPVVSPAPSSPLPASQAPQKAIEPKRRKRRHRASKQQGPSLPVPTLPEQRDQSSPLPSNNNSETNITFR